MGISLAVYRARVGNFVHRKEWESFIFHILCKYLSILLKNFKSKGLCIYLLLFVVLQSRDYVNPLSKDNEHVSSSVNSLCICVYGVLVMCMFWLDILLLIGGIEPNPGPFFELSNYDNKSS